MKKNLIFLGIETSCDETAASVVMQDSKGNAKILSNVVSSQIKIHKKFGGVVPDLASKAHADKIDIIIKQAIYKSKKSFKDIDGVAATAGPGLLVCLMVGMTAGKTIARFLNKPFFGINHLEGHALSAGITNDISYPYLLLLISGGHTQFLSVNKFGDYERIGTTIDDALGEAFDKVAKMLGANIPNGKVIEKMSLKGNPKKYLLPKPILYKSGCNLSFAGLKTAVMLQIKNVKSNQSKYDMAASFQETINEILRIKCSKAMDMFLDLQPKLKNKNFVVAGGVASNKSIRNNLIKLSRSKDFTIIFPPSKLCTDNAAMIAWAGIKHYQKKSKGNFNVESSARWPLDPEAPFMKGPGLKL